MPAESLVFQSNQPLTLAALRPTQLETMLAALSAWLLCCV